MRGIGRILSIAAALAAASLGGAAFAGAPHPRVTGNVALVPASPGATVSLLPKRNVRVSWQRALRAAKKDWGLRTRQVEVIVRAVVTKDSSHGAGWAVVADLTTHNPAPGNTTLYARMVIVVSGRSGKVLFSYPVDPSTPPTPSLGPPPITTPPPPGVTGGASTAATATPPATPMPDMAGVSSRRGPAPTPTPTFRR